MHELEAQSAETMTILTRYTCLDIRHHARAGAGSRSGPLINKATKKRGGTEKFSAEWPVRKAEA